MSDSASYTHDTGLPIKKAADILGYHRDTVKTLMDEGKLEGYGSGRRIRVYESSIMAYRQNEKYRPKREDTNKLKRASKRHAQAMKDLQELLK